MKKISLILISLCAPISVYANIFNDGLYPCKQPPNCNFNDLIQLVQGLAQALIRIALFLSPFIFIYAGYLYITSMENPSKRKDANKFLKNAVIGLAIMLSAYVIIKFILLALLSNTILDSSLFPFSTK